MEDEKAIFAEVVPSEDIDLEHIPLEMLPV